MPPDVIFKFRVLWLSRPPCYTAQLLAHFAGLLQEDALCASFLAPSCAAAAADNCLGSCSLLCGRSRPHLCIFHHLILCLDDSGDCLQLTGLLINNVKGIRNTLLVCWNAFDSDDESSDHIEDEHDAIFDCSGYGYGYAREHFQDLFQSHITTVSQFLNWPQCNHFAKLLTEIRMLRINRA